MMVDSMKENGVMVIFMDSAPIFGRMVGSIKEIIKMVRNMDMGYTNEQMEKAIKENGEMGIWTDKGRFSMDFKLSKGFGVRESLLIGLRLINNFCKITL